AAAVELRPVAVEGGDVRRAEVTAVRPDDREWNGAGSRSGMHRGEVVEAEDARDQGRDVGGQPWLVERGIMTRAAEQKVVDLDAEGPLDRADVALRADDETTRTEL